MTRLDTGFVTYLKAFFVDMLTRMSGPLSVPLAVAALIVSSRTEKVLYACLAVVCALFASYRVWRKERLDAGAQLDEKDKEIAVLRDQINTVTAKQQKPQLKMTVSAEGKPPSQVLRLVANTPVVVSHVDYMLSSDATIASEDVSLQGANIDIPINSDLLLKVWNSPRPDRNHHDHSGPAKLGITVSSDGEQGHQYVLPIQMESVFEHNVAYRRVVGARTFLQPHA